MKRVFTRKSIIKDDIEDLKFKLISNSRFKQQRLPAWRPVPTISVIISVYSIFGILFIAIGIVVLFFSKNIVTIEYRYDEECENKTICDITINILEDMNPPIMVFYKLEGFYQNHRRYLKSKSYIQLYENKDIDFSKPDDFEDCDPIIKNKDLNIELEKTLNNESGAIPCGLMAKTFFNDTFINWKIVKENNTDNLILDESYIAWEKDIELIRNKKKEEQWIDMEDEHFLVWMRPSGLPDVQKLYGRIKDDKYKLNKGDIISLTVNNIYDVSYYKGSKKIILSTVNKLGGKNDFLGIAYIVVGGISILAGIIFSIFYFAKNKGIKVKDD